MKTGRLLVAASVALVLFGGAEVAQATTDTFNVAFDINGNITSGGGSGYNSGEWYWYPNTEWYNQWFYDHPFTYNRYKVIDIEFDITFVDTSSWAEVTINWSTPDWSALSLTRPPLPSDVPDLATENLYIARGDIQDLDPQILGGLGPHHLVYQDIEIPWYNPEWVSVDILAEGATVTNGVITHECVPEPATLGLLCLAAGPLLRRRR